MRSRDYSRDYSPASDRPAWSTYVRGIVLAGRSEWGGSAQDATLRDPLAPVALSPLVGFPLRWLRDAGISDVAICASGSRMPAIREHVGNGATIGLSVVYAEDRSPRGAAGCVRDAVSLMQGGPAAAGGTFVVVEGALIPSVDIPELLRTHWHSEAAVTVVVEVDRRRNIGAGARPHVPGGIYVFDARAIAAIGETGYHDIKQGLIERLYQTGERVATHRVSGLSPRVMDYRSYLAVNRWVIDRTAGQALDGYARVEDALCHHTARVHPGASLVGPVIVGPGATLDDDVVVIGPSAIGAHSRLAPGAVVTRSVVWDRCVIESNAVVDTSVLVSGSVVAADRYLCGGLELPNDTYDWVPAVADDVSPLWRLPVLPHTPLRSSSAPSRTAADLERARLRA